LRSRTTSKALPQSREEIDQKVSRIAELRREIAAKESGLAEDIDKLREKLAESLQPHRDELQQLEESVQASAEARRDELTEGGRTKTVKLTNGVIRWRLRPMRLVMSLSEASIIKALKRRSELGCIRIKEEVDKEALKKRPDLVKSLRGVSLKQKEDFIIETESEAA
jgi:phage host-nuclease inhibitor protein Gam